MCLSYSLVGEPPCLKPINSSHNKVIYWSTKSMLSTRSKPVIQFDWLSALEGSPEIRGQRRCCWCLSCSGRAASFCSLVMSPHIPAALVTVTPGLLLDCRDLRRSSLAFNLRQTTEQTHTFNNPLPYLSDVKVRWGSLGLAPLLAFRCQSKVCLLKIEQRSAFQHEKLEKHVGSCARSRLRAKLVGGVNLESNSFIQAFL